MSEQSEAYCVDSGRPVGPLGGDRCKSHGGRSTPCFLAFRAPRCTHPDWPRWANGSDKCPECRARVTTHPDRDREPGAAMSEMSGLSADLGAERVEALRAVEREHTLLKRGRVYDTCFCRWYGPSHAAHVAERRNALIDGWLVEAEARARDEGIRQAVDWLRADYPYGTGPDWREHGAEWIEDRATEERLHRIARQEGEHEHIWERRQNVTSRGYALPPYRVCKCGAAREDGS